MTTQRKRVVGKGHVGLCVSCCISILGLLALPTARLLFSPRFFSLLYGLALQESVPYFFLLTYTDTHATSNLLDLIRL